MRDSVKMIERNRNTPRVTPSAPVDGPETCHKPLQRKGFAVVAGACPVKSPEEANESNELRAAIAHIWMLRTPPLSPPRVVRGRGQKIARRVKGILGAQSRD